MVQAIINIQNTTNKVLNIIKAKYELKDKSQAIDYMAKEYEELILEPQLKPDYIEKAKEIMKEKAKHIGSVDNLKKEIGL